MSLQPLNAASVVIQVHTWAAILALVFGMVMLLRAKGTAVHRWTGRFWLATMVLTVLSSFFIHELHTWGSWSPIHILSLITLVLLLRAYLAIRARKVRLHAELMKAAFYNALLLATFFTFLPGRIMHEVVFGPTPGDAPDGAVPMWVWILIGVLVVVGGRQLLAMRGRKLAVVGLKRQDPPLP